VAVDSAKAALGEARRAHAGGQGFHFVLADAHMRPIDGLELALQLKESGDFGTPRPVLVGVTGRASERGRAEKLGLDAYLTRPVLPTDLLDTLTRGTRAGQAEGSAVPAASGPARRPRWGLRVLLAEDNKVNQALAAALLRKRRHEVTIVDNGQEAVDLVRRSEFDLVLMDVQMPVMDGFEATRVIREMESGAGRRLPIIAVTAHAMEGDRTRCLQAGMDDYVSKPIDPRELEAAIERWTGELPDFERELALERVNGDESLLAAVAGAFLQQAPDRLQAILMALAGGDAAGAERSARTVEDSAVGLAMPRLRDIAHRVAALSREGDLEAAAALVVELDAAVGSGAAAVRKAVDVA